MTDVRVVYVTAPDAEVAARLGRAVVEAGLAACVNLVPGLRSIYWWEGKVHDDAEVLLIVKTTAAQLDALRDHLVALHPYTVPEVIALPVVAGHEPYLEWVRASARRRPSDSPSG